MSQFVLAVGERAQRTQRALLCFFEVAAQSRLVFLIIYLHLFLLLRHRFSLTCRRGARRHENRCLHWWLVLREHRCEERSLVTVLHFASLSVEDGHGEHGEHNRHILRLGLLELLSLRLLLLLILIYCLSKLVSRVFVAYLHLFQLQQRYVFKRLLKLTNYLLPTRQSN